MVRRLSARADAASGQHDAPSPSSESCAQRWQTSPTVTVSQHFLPAHAGGVCDPLLGLGRLDLLGVGHHPFGFSTLHHHDAVGVGVGVGVDVTREYDDSGDYDWLLQPAGPRWQGSAGVTTRANTGIPHSARPSASRTAPSMTKPPTRIDLARMPIRSPMSALVRSPSPLMTMMSPGCARSRGSNPGLPLFSELAPDWPRTAGVSPGSHISGATAWNQRGHRGTRFRISGRVVAQRRAANHSEHRRADVLKPYPTLQGHQDPMNSGSETHVSR